MNVITAKTRNALTAALAFAAFALPASQASAVSMAVKVACMGDYLSYCSQHGVDTPGLRQCMRTNGLRLSKSCVNALVTAGEVSKSEVAKRAASAK